MTGPPMSQVSQPRTKEQNAVYVRQDPKGQALPAGWTVFWRRHIYEKPTINQRMVDGETATAGR